MTENDDDAAGLMEVGRLLFAGTADFVHAAPELGALPPMEGVEIAFAGRSNVGKSSLINALTGRNTLARTSHTPGRTQQLNFFRIGERLSLVDMPGYGYAAVEKAKVEAWTRLIHAYLKGRSSLARVFMLIDARHGIKEVDREILQMLDAAAVGYRLVLTKADKIKASELAEVTERTAAEARKRAAAHPDILVTSSEKGMGVAELRAAVIEAIG